MAGGAKLSHPFPGVRGKGAVLLIILCLAVFLTLWWMGSRVWHFVQIRMVKIDWLHPGTVYQTVSTSGWLIKDEQVLIAPGRGELMLLVDDGQRVRAGAEVGEIILDDTNEAKISIRTSRPGIFCTHLDGLETVLRPGLLNTLEMDAVEKLGVKPASPGTGSRVEKGQPVGKVVDNLPPLRYWGRIPRDQMAAEKLTPGRTLFVYWQGRKIPGRVEKLEDVNGYHYFVMLLSSYPGDLVHQREVKMDLLKEELAGFLVPAKAVVERGTQPGIYVVLKQRARWVPVQVLGRMSDQMAISGINLSARTRFVTNPFGVREGDRLE